MTFNKYYEYFLVERPAEWQERVGDHLFDEPTDQPDPQWERPDRH